MGEPIITPEAAADLDDAWDYLSLILLYRYNFSSFFNRGMMLRERW